MLWDLRLLLHIHIHNLASDQMSVVKISAKA
jgi:hypothetical protein